MLASSRDGKYVEFIEKLTGNKLVRRQMMDIEVRDAPPRRDDKRGGRGRDRGRDAKHRGHRPADGKYHDQVAAIEPTREAAVETSAPTPAIADAPAPQKREHHHRQSQAHQAQSHQAKPHQTKPQHEKGGHENRRQEKSGQPRHEHPRHEKASQHQHNERARQPEAVDKNQLPAFLFRTVPGKKPEPK
jgi:hypothetical protein